MPLCTFSLAAAGHRRTAAAAKDLNKRKDSAMSISMRTIDPEALLAPKV
jgi:hypothetical protein